MNSIQLTPRRRQRGVSTLLIAMLLLAILTVIAIFSVNVGLFEQRTSGNEYRYKLAFQTAETGINQSIEYLRGNTRSMLSTASGGWLPPATTARWQSCTDPLPTGMALDPCLAESDSTRRANMFRYVGSTNGVLPVASMMSGAASITTSGGGANFATSYQSFATLCRLDMTIPEKPVCSSAPTNEGTFYVTIVSRGQLTDESAEAVVKQSFGTFRLLGAVPAAPLIAAGTATGLGNAQIVPNPDAGGFSVPVSIWSSGNAKIDQASFASCQLGEWLANYGTPAPTSADLLDGVCESCTCNGLCPGYGLLSGDAKSCAVAKDKIEGEDILDKDSHYSDASPKVRDSTNFPTDLFEYVFDVPSAQADDYLAKYAKPLADCASLNATSEGLYWYKGTDCKLGTDVGSLQYPVVLVSDGVVTLSANSTYFGILFVRSKAGTGELLKASGGGQVYGSVILEGEASIAGNPTIVYNKAVLQNISNSPAFVRYGPIPGSWSDRYQDASATP